MNKIDYIKMNNLDKVNVFIYCSGKSGGSCLTHSFKMNGFNVIHVHGNKCHGFYNENNIDFNIITTNELIEHNSQYNKVYIIDSYRTPIERKISAFFQNIETYLENPRIEYTADIIKYFNEENFIYRIEEYQSLNKPFKKVGDHYEYIEKNKIYIKIRLCDSYKWETIFSKIFNQKIKIFPFNRTKNEIYTKFLELYKVPKKYLELTLQNDKYFNFFMSKEEKESYIQKWEKKSFDEEKNYIFLSVCSSKLQYSLSEYTSNLNSYGIFPEILFYDEKQFILNKLITVYNFLNKIDHDTLIVQIEPYGVIIKDPLELIRNYNNKFNITAEKEFTEKDPYNKSFFDQEKENVILNGGLKITKCKYYKEILREILRNNKKYICDNLFSEQIIFSRYSQDVPNLIHINNEFNSLFTINKKIKVEHANNNTMIVI